MPSQAPYVWIWSFNPIVPSSFSQVWWKTCVNYHLQNSTDVPGGFKSRPIEDTLAYCHHTLEQSSSRASLYRTESFSTKSQSVLIRLSFMWWRDTSPQHDTGTTMPQYADICHGEQSIRYQTNIYRFGLIRQNLNWFKEPLYDLFSPTWLRRRRAGSLNINGSF